MQMVTDPDDVRRVLGDMAPVSATGQRALMARFSSGTDHERRRGHVLTALATVDAEQVRGLARARTEELVATGGVIDIMPLARRVPVAVLKEVIAPGDSTDPEVIASRAGILVQAADATAGLIANAVLLGAMINLPAARLIEETLRLNPPVRTTRRIHDGAEYVVDLSRYPFGVPPRECPGRELAVAIAEAVVGVVLRGRLVSNQHMPERVEVYFG